MRGGCTVSKPIRKILPKNSDNIILCCKQLIIVAIIGSLKEVCTISIQHASTYLLLDAMFHNQLHIFRTFYNGQKSSVNVFWSFDIATIGKTRAVIEPNKRIFAFSTKLLSTFGAKTVNLRQTSFNRLPRSAVLNPFHTRGPLGKFFLGSPTTKKFFSHKISWDSRTTWSISSRFSDHLGPQLKKSRQIFQVPVLDNPLQLYFYFMLRSRLISSDSHEKLQKCYKFSCFHIFSLESENLRPCSRITRHMAADHQWSAATGWEPLS